MAEEEIVKNWRIGMCVLVVALIVSATGTAQQGGQNAPQQLVSNVKVGDPAPDFTLPDHTGKQVKLSDFKGKKNVVLAFYVAAFTAG
jgi:cytochrome oxidase Cu insertion factor (SCO1/SenC/PrrC family)